MSLLLKRKKKLQEVVSNNKSRVARVTGKLDRWKVLETVVRFLIFLEPVLPSSSLLYLRRCFTDPRKTETSRMTFSTVYFHQRFPRVPFTYYIHVFWPLSLLLRVCISRHREKKTCSFSSSHGVTKNRAANNCQQYRRIAQTFSLSSPTISGISSLPCTYVCMFIFFFWISFIATRKKNTRTHNKDCVASDSFCYSKRFQRSRNIWVHIRVAKSSLFSRSSFFFPLVVYSRASYEYLSTKSLFTRSFLSEIYTVT